MLRAFRKYHRQIAIIAALPLLVTVISGMGITIAEEWLHQGKIEHFFKELHTFEILGIGKIYPILNGIGLIGLLVTGFTMTGLFKKRPQSKQE